LPEPTNANESCTNDLQKKDSKNASELLNETKQSLDNPSVKETNHEDDEKDEDTKVNTEEDAESNVQSNIAKEDDKTNKEVTPSVEEVAPFVEEVAPSVEEVAPSVETDKDIKQATPKQENNIIDEDDDDYLLYLEDILRRIHTEFYATLDQENTRKSLRDIIPRVRSQVLKGLCLTFSGLIPTHQKLHQSRAYKVARAFGAEVTQVTHLYLFFFFQYVIFL